MVRKAEKIAKRARMACEKWRTYFKYNIDQYHDMHQFVMGHQWEEAEEELLVQNKKIPMTANKLATMANSLLGEQQQNTPQLQVVPMTNCNEETANVRELIVKDIVFNNDSTTTYQVAASQAVIGGFGAFCIDTDYDHSKSFDLNIKIHYFKDSSRTYFDVGAEQVNKTDGMVGGYITRLTRTKFRANWGKRVEEMVLKESGITASEEEIALAVQPDANFEDPFSWADDESITILHHYERKFKKQLLYKLSNGRVLDEDEMNELRDSSMAMQQQDLLSELMGMDGMQQNLMLPAPGQSNPYEPDQPDTAQELPENPESINEEPQPSNDIMTLYDEGEPVRIVEQREIKRSIIHHYLIAGDYILDESEFPAEQIPVVFVDQNSFYDKDGKQVCRSFFADVRDTQRYINYLRTQSAYILKVSRYDQFIGSKKNVQSVDTQRNWKDPASIQGLLAYDESPTGAKPEQLRPPELSASLLTQYQLAIEDLYTSTGLYPTRMGQQGNEVSGAAIDARTRQGNYSTYIVFNSINRSIATAGSIVNEMIPRVYDAERVITLMTPEEGLKNITVNRQADAYGERIENDITKGTYQVRLKPGPSYEGQKEQALESLQQILKANPEAFSLVADLYADNLPLANNLELKNRLKTMVPPDIIEAGKTGKSPQEMGQNQPSPEQIQLQLQQQQIQMEAQYKNQQIELKKQELEIKKQQMMLDYEMELKELETERMEAASKIKEQELRYMAETQRTETDTAIAHANNLVKILTHKIPDLHGKEGRE